MTLVVEDLRVTLGGRTVLSDIALQTGAGEVVAVVGPNGAGKSTLLRALGGTLRVARGRASWAGKDLFRASVRDRARLVGLVPQMVHLDHPFTVEEVVAMGRHAHRGRLGWGADAAPGAVADALRATGLVPLADRSVMALSGGERQRVSIARVLAQAPELYLMDEPTANLDLGQAAAVLRLIRRLAEAGQTVMAVVHDLEVASRVADRIVLLARGRIVAEGPPRSVLTPALLEEAFQVPAQVSWDANEARVRVRERSDPSAE